ncbi:MAG: 1-(5-phosphoribosyl)-5-[(5-phosphoribosylamino)methylideneamino] imidazole-4-carboxamide isomerase [Gemmatimonadetes bacterium]|nr:1-(5-phosphoribosyl)-5-[(5-phosphoribosylamino)methylideneamino] imidazole-4-carboxamide isomerase [Gemmatimonadota bacterium]
MLAIPAIDLREGHVVQLAGASFEDEVVRLDDPLRIAHQWALAGFTRLHVVDLDAASERGSNRDVIVRLLHAGAAPCQVGGGVRSERQVHDLLEAGAAGVMLGTRALEDPDWLARVAFAHPGRCLLAADVRERRLVTRGWTQTLPREVLSAVDDVAALPLAGLLVTAVHREGRMEGTDLRLMEEVAEASPFPVFAAGGIGTMADLWALEERGVAAAVIGMALYAGVLDPRRVAEEFAL